MPNTREKLIEWLCEAMLIFDKKKNEPNINPFEVFADHLIANGVTVQKWISVKDRLPESVDSYIIAIKYKYDCEKEYNYGTDVATYNLFEGGYIDDCWDTYNDWDEGQQYIHATHWMPLPEPPKGE